MQRPRLLLLAASVPLAAYLATVGGSGYFLDAGELVAASVALDIAHPPGEPLASLYGKLLGFLPLGSLAFRIALGQALAAALACGLLCLTAWRALLAAAPSLPAAVRVPLALLPPVLWGSSYAIWMQAVRPEVYALQALLLVLAGERLATFHAPEAAVEASGTPRPSTRALYVAALAVGLGLANHPAMSVLAMPALVHAAARTRRVRPWLLCAGLGALGLLVYAYLPIRALTDPPFDLGDPRTLERFLWVVSSRLYAWRVGDAEVEPIADRFAAALGVVLDATHVVGFVLALLGGYFVLRASRSRALGVGLWLQAAGSLVISPLINPPAGNPDAMGYMALGLGALCVLASVGIAVPLQLLCARGERATSFARALSLALLLGFGFEHVARNRDAVDLARFVATDAFDDLRLRTLPPRALLIASMPQTVFRLQELVVVDRVRPDVALLALPLASYPGAVEVLRRTRPELHPLAADLQATGELSAPALAAAAARRPVLIELDAHLSPSLYRNFVPVGGLHALVDQNVAKLLWPRARALQAQSYGRLLRLLGAGIAERETTRQLLYMRYVDALHAAAIGEREAALESVRAALALAPRDTRLQELAAAIEAMPSGAALDVSAFLGSTGAR